ncbi:MAG: hypothetical protein ACI4L7_02440 [Christensenellales bacterium]
MTKKKLIITITSLCLVVVAAVAAVVGILAATQVNITSSLKVTYTPTPQVIATVSARYSLKGDSAATPINNTVITEYTSTTSDYTLDLTNVTLDDTKTYVVFEFKFKNDAVVGNTNSKTLHVAVAGTPTVSNMTVTTRYSASEVDLTDTAVKGISDANTVDSVLKNIGLNSEGYMYVLVERTEGIAGSWEAASFAFTLTASENPTA